MSWTNICKSCKLREACARGEVDAHFVSGDCDGNECTAWVPDDCHDRTKKEDSNEEH